MLPQFLHAQNVRGKIWKNNSRDLPLAPLMEEWIFQEDLAAAGPVAIPAAPVHAQ